MSYPATPNRGAANATYESWVLPVYAATIGLLTLLALIALLASREMEPERMASVGGIKDTVRRMLDS